MRIVHRRLTEQMLLTTIFGCIKSVSAEQNYPEADTDTDAKKLMNSLHVSEVLTTLRYGQILTISKISHNAIHSDCV